MRVSVRFHGKSLPLSRGQSARRGWWAALRKSDDARSCPGSPRVPDDMRKDVYGHYLLRTNFATLHNPKKIRQRNVRAGCIVPMWQAINGRRMDCDISTAWADCVAYPWERQCEGLYVG